jgi:hypothetical protein
MSFKHRVHIGIEEKKNWTKGHNVLKIFKKWSSLMSYSHRVHIGIEEKNWTKGHNILKIFFKNDLL